MFLLCLVAQKNFNQARTIASLNTTFEIENINVNIKKSFASLDFSTFWKFSYFFKILLNKIDQNPGFLK